MGLFAWLFRKAAAPAPPRGKRYDYPTGNVELALRVQGGEDLMAVLADVKRRWTPGNEHLWDDKTGFFHDLRRDQTRLTDVKTIGAYWALLADVVPPERLTRFVSHLVGVLSDLRRVVL